MKYAFFIDIDGTLTYGNSIPDENISAMEYARSNGHLMLINTGRSLRFIPRFVLRDAPLDGIVAGSGSYCELGGKILKAESIGHDDLKKTVSFMLSEGLQFMLEGENVILCGNRHVDAEGFYDIATAEQLDGEYSGALIEKINISGMLSGEQTKFMKEMFGLWQHRDYAECALKGCDKGNAMRLVMEHLPDYKCVAVGDSINDIDMLRAADISVAMGNSSDEIKNMCDIVTDDNGSAGLGKAISMLICKEELSV